MQSMTRRRCNLLYVFSIGTDLQRQSERGGQEAKEDKQSDHGRMRCCISDCHTSFSSQSPNTKSKWIPRLRRIYIPTSPPGLCPDWTHFLWWSMIQTPHLPAYVINSSPLLICNRWSRCWPWLVSCVYHMKDSALSEMTHLKLFCCWTRSDPPTVQQVRQTDGLCPTFVITFTFTSSHVLLIRGMTCSVYSGWISTLGSQQAICPLFCLLQPQCRRADCCRRHVGLHAHKAEAGRKLELNFIEIVSII